jgi:hypothetical protein
LCAVVPTITAYEGTRVCSGVRCLSMGGLCGLPLDSRSGVTWRSMAGQGRRLRGSLGVWGGEFALRAIGRYLHVIQAARDRRAGGSVCMYSWICRTGLPSAAIIIIWDFHPTVVAALLKGEGQATGTCELRVVAAKGPACAVLCCLHLPPPHKHWASGPADSLDAATAADHDIPSSATCWLCR